MNDAINKTLVFHVFNVLDTPKSQVKTLSHSLRLYHLPYNFTYVKLYVLLILTVMVFNKCTISAVAILCPFFWILSHK